MQVSNQAHDVWFETVTHLVLALPVQNVIYLTPSTDIDMLARADEHVTCGDYVRDRRQSRMFSRQHTAIGMLYAAPR